MVIHQELNITLWQLRETNVEASRSPLLLFRSAGLNVSRVDFKNPLARTMAIDENLPCTQVFQEHEAGKS
jgi:hypothetical protein